MQIFGGVPQHKDRHKYGGPDTFGTDELDEAQINKTIAAESSVSVSAASTSTLPKGIYYVRTAATTPVEFSDGGSPATCYTLVAAGSQGFVISDGSKVRFNNGNASAAETSYLYKIG